MKAPGPTRVLVVEDNPKDLTRLRRTFTGVASRRFELRTAKRLADALGHLGTGAFDIVLLKLDLPDSRGIETFARVHQRVPTMPVLVLAGAEEDAMAEQAVEQGAQDYLVKNRLEPQVLAKSIRYAIEQSRLNQELAAERQRQHQERELTGIDRLSRREGTSVTSQMYSGHPLREVARTEFAALVDRYRELLDQALEHRLFKAGHGISEGLREIAETLGFLRATPRDVIEIHTTALRLLVEGVPWQRAQAYLQEGRLSVLELMGYLTGYYRNHPPGSRRKDLGS